jgi:hypothetical protein
MQTPQGLDAKHSGELFPVKRQYTGINSGTRRAPVAVQKFGFSYTLMLWCDTVRTRQNTNCSRQFHAGFGTEMATRSVPSGGALS